MDNKIKDEFKEFINTLSTEICKKVLVEDLKTINDSFGKTSDNYKQLEVNYTKNINGIKDQLNQLQNTNRKINEFINNISVNNDKINKALVVIDGSHKNVIDNIIADNKKLFHQYSKDVQALNDSEKKKIISELILSINNQSQKHLLEMRSIVNGSKVTEIFQNTNILINKMNSIEIRGINLERNLGSSEEKVIEDINKRISNAKNQVINMVNQSNSKTDNILNELNDKIANVNTQLSKKNNVIIILTSIIIVLCIIILFKK